MPTEFSIDYRHKVLMIKARGKVEIPDLFGYKRKLRSRPNVAAYSALLDLRGVEEVAQPSADQIRELAANFARSTALKPTQQLAVVTHKDFLFGLARMFQTYCEVEHTCTTQIGIFLTMPAALDFLNLPEDVFLEDFWESVRPEGQA